MKRLFVIVTMSTASLFACAPLPDENKACVSAPKVAKFSATPEIGPAPLEVYFTLDATAATIGECGPLIYSFDFSGDGKADDTSTENTASFSFPTEGTYLVTATVGSKFSKAVSMATLAIHVEPEKKDDTEWITPISAVASNETKWGGTWYTGPATYSIDGSKTTAWTLNDMGYLQFDLGEERTILGIEAYWGGHVTNGNTINLYVENTQVLEEEQFGATTNLREFSAVNGQIIKYETVALPHNEYLQVASWSEMSEFRVLVRKLP